MDVAANGERGRQARVPHRIELSFEDHVDAREQGRADRPAKLQQRSIGGGGSGQVGVARRHAPHRGAHGETAREDGVGQRSRGAGRRSVRAGGSIQVELSHGKRQRERRTAARQERGPIAALESGLEAVPEGDLVADAEAMPRQQLGRTVVKRFLSESDPAESEVVAILADAVGENARRRVVRRGEFLRAPEGVAHDIADLSDPTAHRQVAHLERTGRDLLLPQEDAIHVHVERRGSEDGAGQLRQRLADEIGIQRELAGDADATELGSAAELRGEADGVADLHPAHLARIVDQEVGETAHDRMIGEHGETREAEIPAEAGADLARPAQRAVTVSGHRIVEERARVPVQHHSRRADHGTEIDRSGLQQPRLRNNPDRQRLRIEASPGRAGSTFSGSPHSWMTSWSACTGWPVSIGPPPSRE